MKNTTKKILSMLLAVIMLLSVMPVAYAEKATYPPQVEEMLKLAYKCLTYNLNYYLYEDIYVKGLSGIINNFPVEQKIIKQAEEKFESYGYKDSEGYYIYYPDFIEEPFYDKVNDDDFLESIRVYTELWQTITDVVDELIESGKIVCVLDMTGYIEATYKPRAYYYDISELTDKQILIYDELFEIADEVDDYLSLDPEDYNQEEFDAIWKKGLPVAEKIFNCLDGNHPYGEYISDNNATCTEYGTKTATCEVCDATDTVADKASGLASHNGKAILVTEATCTTDGYTTFNCECGYVYTDDYKPATGHSYADGKCTLCGDEYENCSCNCHKSGFMGFIWKIINFFNKIFGSNKLCTCGVAHY